LSLIKTSLLNAVAVGVRMLTLLSINKILAVYVGPTGYAALGQFQNAVQIISALASGAINTGVTKYTAEFENNEAQQSAIWRTAGKIALSSAGVLSIVVFLFRETLAFWFLGDDKLGAVFGWLAVALIPFVLNSLLLAILNGKNDIARYVLANIAGSVFALGLTALLVVNFGLLGALISLAVYQSLAFLVTLSLCVTAPWLRWRMLVGQVDWSVAKNLAKYASMAVVTAATVPLCHIQIRDFLGQEIGWEAAGYWEAMWRLSGAYLMFITSTLSVYLVPKFSSLFTVEELKLEILSTYKFVMPLVFFTVIFLYICRDFIIQNLFSLEFSNMRVLFFWQLVGDFLKIGSWIIASILLSKAMYIEFIVSEIFFSILFYFLVRFLVPFYGLEGAAIAHAVNYLLYWIFVLLIIVKNKSHITKHSL
jgi:PST family polysaccharide transporter